MNAEQTLVVAATMNRLPFVRWDRFIDWEYDEGGSGCLVYGWIDRSDEPLAKRVAIMARLKVLDTEHAGRTLPGPVAAEWEGLQQELDRIETTLQRLRGPDARADFVTLQFETAWGWNAEDASACTSSVARSEEIRTLLRGNADGHRHCQRVEEHFAHLVHNVVVLERSAES